LYLPVLFGGHNGRSQSLYFLFDQQFFSFHPALLPFLGVVFRAKL